MQHFNYVNDERTMAKQSTDDLFQDHTFPPNSRSLNVDGTQQEDVVWKRPSEIVSNPKFIVGDASRQDLDQGGLGDCWYIASAASLAATQPDMLEYVIMPAQGFETHQYSGQFHFKFWWHGKWENVSIDDYLPTRHNQLIYCKCDETSNEFWPCLLEKAYAKLHGSYGNLDGGFEEDAMVDLTGGIPHSIHISKTEDESFYERLKRAFDKKTLMGASITADKVNEEKKANGLLTGHAYSITKFLDIVDDGEMNAVTPVRYRLLRVRNPWGNAFEWKGEWSDNFIQDASTKMKKILGPVQNDGEFWISFENFISNFDWISLCYTNPNAWVTNDNESFADYTWKENICQGTVVKETTANKHREENEIFQQNTKYQFDLQTSNKSPVIISVMTKGCNNATNVYVGFDIYQANTDKLVYGSQFRNRRDVTNRLLLPRGSYYVKAKTTQEQECVDFTLRVFTVAPKTVGPNAKTKMTKQDVDIQQIYDNIAGNDNKMDVNELNRFLSEMASSDFITPDPGLRVSFNIELCRTLHTWFDTDCSTFLSLKEILMGCKEIKKCLNVFISFKPADKDYVDTYNIYEMFEALGIEISQKLMIAIERRYGGRNSVLTAEDFIMAFCRLKSLLKSFESFSDVNNPLVVEEMLVAAILR